MDSVAWDFWDLTFSHAEGNGMRDPCILDFFGKSFSLPCSKVWDCATPWARDLRGVILRIFPVPGSNAGKLRHGTLGFVFHSRSLGWKNKEKEGESKSKQPSIWDFVWSRAGKTDLYQLQEQLQAPGMGMGA